jgi:uncharacterized protein YpmB
MNKTILIGIIIIVLVGAGSFYGGMKYGQSRNPFANFSRQNFLAGQGQQSGQGNGTRRTGSNFLSGEVVSKDQQSLTVKMPDNSSKIVFFSASTTVSQMAQGSSNDIGVGEQITVTGQQNSDGSYTAQTIQIRPTLPNQ